MFDAAKLLLVFAVLVVFLMRRANLGAVMAGAAALLGILFQLDAAGFWRSLVQTITNVTNIDLIVALGLIMVLEDLMGHTGILQRMVTSLRGLVGDSRVVMAVLPALVGLIPSAGGAIFSAPMIDEVSRGSDLTPERKTFINFWYRHVWEYILPLYPALLLTAQVYGVTIPSLIVLMLPVPLLVFVIGWPFAFAGYSGKSDHVPDPNTAQHIRDLAFGIGPLFLILILVLALHTSISMAIAMVLILLLIAYRWTPSKTVATVRHSLSLNVLFSVFAVLFFKEVLVVSGGVQALTPLFTASQIPLGVAFATLPFLIGVLTGSPQAVVGTAGPILISLSGSPEVSPALAATAMMSGYGGCMLSPAHLCFVLTNGYFHANFVKSYQKVVVPELLLMGITFAYLALV